MVQIANPIHLGGLRSDPQTAVLHLPARPVAPQAQKLLEPFAGLLQSDGYSVYELLNKMMPSITLLNCWAHARREFVKAQDNDHARAQCR